MIILIVLILIETWEDLQIFLKDILKRKIFLKEIPYPLMLYSLSVVFSACDIYPPTFDGKSTV